MSYLICCLGLLACLPPDSRENIESETQVLEPDEIYAEIEESPAESDWYLRERNSITFPLENKAYEPSGSYTSGEFDDQKYHNSFFGFSINVPSRWEILYDHDINAVLEDEGSTKNLVPLDAAKKLLTIQRDIPFPFVHFYAEKQSVSGAADAPAYFDFIYDDYIGKFGSGYPKYEYWDKGYEFIGLKNFCFQEFKVETENYLYHERMYCAQFDNYFLVAIGGYQTEYQYKKVREALKAIKWDDDPKW